MTFNMLCPFAFKFDMITRPRRRRVEVSAPYLFYLFLVVLRCDMHASRRASNEDETSYSYKFRIIRKLHYSSEITITSTKLQCYFVYT